MPSLLGNASVANASIQQPREQPPQRADVAQSVLFEAMLVDQIEELMDRAAIVERRWLRRCERDMEGAVTRPRELKSLRQRIGEARRLLDAVHTRFPPG